MIFSDCAEVRLEAALHSWELRSSRVLERLFALESAVLVIEDQGAAESDLSLVTRIFSSDTESAGAVRWRTERFVWAAWAASDDEPVSFAKLPATLIHFIFDHVWRGSVLDASVNAEMPCDRTAECAVIGHLAAERPAFAFIKMPRISPTVLMWLPTDCDATARERFADATDHLFWLFDERHRRAFGCGLELRAGGRANPLMCCSAAGAHAELERMRTLRGGTPGM